MGGQCLRWSASKLTPLFGRQDGFRMDEREYWKVRWNIAVRCSHGRFEDGLSDEQLWFQRSYRLCVRDL